MNTRRNDSESRILPPARRAAALLAAAGCHAKAKAYAQALIANNDAPDELKQQARALTE